MIRLYFAWAVTSMLYASGYAQNLNISTGSEIQEFHEHRWIELDAGRTVTTQQFVDQLANEYAVQLRMAENPLLTRSSKLKFERTTLQQQYQGLDIEFAQVFVHSENGVARKANGVIVPELGIVTTEPKLIESQALELALECVGAGSYYWEHEELERAKQYATGDPSATFYPEGTLLIADQDFDHRSPDEFRLAWKFEIYSRHPESRDWVYVDASSGEIFKELNLNHTENGFVGTAETRYNGLREIITDTTEGAYVLRDYTRGLGIETFDAQDSFSVDYATDFMDDDNFWNNVNERGNDAAPDAHFASEQLYDYLLDRYGIDSYDGRGSRMISYIHYGESWRNASWNGFWGQYGNATGDPWVFCDVVGHEYAHGFTWATSQLLYTRESGALNESFSDILGEALERFIYGENDWYATPAPVDTIRAYLNPNRFEDPDTYLGDFWVTESFDNFGVHSNSGVSNFMFYLLVNGGEGINDNGDEYSVDGIGFDAAMDLLIHAMTVYLFPTSGFADARQAYLFSADDIYGSCSNEYRQVASAWHAVGVGQPAELEDFTVLGIIEKDICGREDEEEVTVQIQHLGCNTVGPISIEITLLKSNPPQNYKETIEIESVGAGEVIEYTLSESFNFSRVGTHSLTAKVEAEGDNNDGNNTAQEAFVYNPRSPELQRFSFYTNFTPRSFRDTMILKNSQFALIGVDDFSGRDSTAGLMIEGNRSRYANPVLPGQDPFDLNESLGTEICFCVDATNYDSLGFQFDLRQTYSSDFERTIGYDQPPTSAMRMLIDEDEIARYFPETNNEDEWMTHYHDLSSYTGLDFLLCMETRTIQDIRSDHDSIGDRVFLDNIEFTGSLVQTSAREAGVARPLRVFPNPASDHFFFATTDNEIEQGQLSLFDLSGQLIMSRKLEGAGMDQVKIDLDGVASGVYLVQFQTASKRYSARLLKQ